jgi:hypothetical protein
MVMSTAKVVGSVEDSVMNVGTLLQAGQFRNHSLVAGKAKDFVSFS